MPFRMEATPTAPAPTKTKRTRAAWCLFAIGIVSSLLGLMGNLADYVPAVQMIVSPEYARCKVGLETLQKSLKLERGQIGCEELAHIILKQLAINRPEATNINFGPIESITLEPSFGVVFSAGRAPESGVAKLKADFKNDGIKDIKLPHIQTLVDQLKIESKAQYSIVLWSVGLGSLVAGFLTKK
jgi:hypothetical protein